ncbi:MAG TPA: TonB-dependent receptor, partial [Lacunisphaera sp.]|nr:TonB-dependent receptor [Lacunisphaera sp.]
PWIVEGGPRFKAEILEAYELGWRGQPTNAISLTATAYFHDYSDLRSVEPNALTVFPFTVQNLVAGRSYGVELFADCDLASWWRLRAGGFVMNQKTWLQPGGADAEGGFGEASFPEYQAQLRSTFYLGRSLVWWTSLRHVAEVPAFEDGNGVVPAYTELDMTLTWSSPNGMEISVSGRNLLDASHPEIGGLDVRREIPRSVQTAIRYKF